MAHPLWFGGFVALVAGLFTFLVKSGTADPRGDEDTWAGFDNSPGPDADDHHGHDAPGEHDSDGDH